MKVWLIQTGEPNPFVGQTTRLYRTGMLAQRLHQSGHDVTWWSGTFDHVAKRHHCDNFKSVRSAAGYEVLLLPGCAYKKNVSVRRLINHVQLAWNFERRCRQQPRPDIIHCAMPSIELCHRVAAYARREGIPLVVDIRDLWPDIFVLGRKRWFRALASTPIGVLDGLLRAALRSATGVTAVSEGYLQWGLNKVGRARRDQDQVFQLGYESPVRAGPDEASKVWLASLKLNDGRINCWFVGTFGRTYNLKTVIAAAGELARRGDLRFRFILSGKGEEEAPLQAQARGMDNVTFTGWLDQKRLVALMSAMEVGLAAYTADAPQSVPNKIGEYASGGLAILSSLKGEGRQLLEKYDCGLSYDAGDPYSLVAALEQVAGDLGRCRKLRRNARLMYEAEFDAERIYGRMVGYLVGLLDSAPKAA